MWTTTHPECFAAVCGIEPSMVRVTIKPPRFTVRFRSAMYSRSQIQIRVPGQEPERIASAHGAGFGELQAHSSVPALQELSGLDLAMPDLPACLWAPAPFRFHPGENFSFGADNSCHSIFCTGLHPSLAVLFCNVLSHIIAA